MNFKKIISKTRNHHFLSLAGNVSMALLSVITYAMLYRLLPERDMGNWIFFQTLFALADAIRTGFLQTALIKFYAGASASRKSDVAGSAWWLAIIISLIIALPALGFNLFFAHRVDTETLFFVGCYGLSYLATCPFNVALWILQAEQRFDRILFLRIINQFSFIACLIVLFYTHQISIRNVVIFYIACSVVSSLLPILLNWSKWKTLATRTRECVQEFVRFGRFSVGTYLFSTVFKYSDSLIIKFMIGPAALAVYNLAQRLLEMIEILMRSFVATAMPAMSMAFNQSDNDRVVNIMKKYTGALTIILVPVIIAILVLADVIVAVIGGHKYADTQAANILRIFMISAIMFPLDRFSGITLDIIHKPQMNLVKIVLCLAINVAGDIVAIRFFGNIYGVAFASILTILTGASFGYITLNKYLTFNLNGILKLGYAELKALVSGFFRKKQVA